VDAGRIAEINVAGWRAAYRGLIADSYLQAMDHQVVRDRWAAGLRNQTDPAAMFVAVGEDAVIRAYAFVRDVRDEADRHPERRTGELIAIYADPAWRGRGRATPCTGRRWSTWPRTGSGMRCCGC
jgi:GNAT superfamily N-acetyltransferase